MRVLALMPDGYGGFGGIAQYIRDLFDALSPSAHVDSIFALARNVPDPAYSLPAKLTERIYTGSPARYIIAAMAAALRVRPHVILCGHINLLPLAVVLKKMTGAPIVLLAYGIEVWRRESRTRAFSLRHVDLLISISRFTRDQLLHWSGFDPQRVKIIPNAIQITRYRQTEKPDYLLRRYGLTGKRILLTLGRLDRSEQYKGHDETVALLKDLAAEFPDIAYLIVGDGNDRARLEKLVRSAGVEKLVIFAGRIPESEKIDHYNLADAFAMPSKGEGFGFVFLEAAACGLPVLGGNKDGSVDALVDGRLGVLIDPDDPADLLQGLIKILRTPKHIPDCLEPFDFPHFKRKFEDAVVLAAGMTKNKAAALSSMRQE